MLTETLRRAFGGRPFSAAEAGQVLGIRGTSSTLNRLKSAGVIERIGRGVYRFASLSGWTRLEVALAREQVRSSRAGRERTLAQVARARWSAWKRSGYVETLGPRRFRLRIQTEAGVGLHVRRR